MNEKLDLATVIISSLEDSLGWLDESARSTWDNTIETAAENLILVLLDKKLINIDKE